MRSLEARCKYGQACAPSIHDAEMPPQLPNSIFLDAAKCIEESAKCVRTECERRSQDVKECEPKSPAPASPLPLFQTPRAIQHTPSPVSNQVKTVLAQQLIVRWCFAALKLNEDDQRFGSHNQVSTATDAFNFAWDSVDLEL